jgi:hypothetical protein
MLGIIGTLLFMTWVSDYALAFTPRFMQFPLLALACMFLAADLLRSQVSREDREVADTSTPSAILK